ncbi:lytic transglycosylase [Thiobacter aerophilum]|uniref:LysM peptidoglycan-binding domain-containing protein n=1 Tax=Thiobacter aerophilum TaxID=3121275 RepID=A0ABV0EBF7_9BURK
MRNGPHRRTQLATLLIAAGLLASPLHAADEALRLAQVSGMTLPETADASDEAPSIISIESAPDGIEPLLKAIDEQGDPRTDLWARLRAGFALPELDTPLVAENEAWYAERPDYVARMLERSRRYLFYIVEEVERRGMPTEIALLPMIESAFNPHALSRAKAAGIWQFMPATGRTFGLQQNWWVDERRDVLAATRAALDYLQKLYAMFGDWHLALAAYNWGEGNLSRAIARNQAQGLPTDYVNLRMPVETANYVPRLLAVKHLVERPQDFSARLGPLPNSPYFAQITLTRHMDVALAARLAEIPLTEFLSLNPHYNRPVIRAQEPTTLLLPVDKAEVFARNLEGHQQPLVSWRTYQAGKGEHLEAIARRYGISPTRLREVNGLGPTVRKLGRGQLLLVPGTASTPLQAPQTTAKAETSRLSHTVRRGETLAAIARRHGVSVAELKSWNRLASSHLTPNQKLLVSPPQAHTEQARRDGRTQVAAAKSAKRGPLRYTVKRGDTLYGIAQRFDVQVDDLRRWNKLGRSTQLRPGDTLLLARADHSG